MPDTFADRTPGLESPASSSFDIVPDDEADLPVVTRALYVGGFGDLVVILDGDTTARTLKSASIGYHPLRVRRVLDATTATDIVGLV